MDIFTCYEVLGWLSHSLSQHFKDVVWSSFILRWFWWEITYHLHVFFLLYLMWHFLWIHSIHFLNVWWFDYNVPRCHFLCFYPFGGIFLISLLDVLGLVSLYLPSNLGKILPLFLQLCFCTIISYLYSNYMDVAVLDTVLQVTKGLQFFFQSLYFLCASLWLISSIISSNSLISFVTVSNLLFHQISEFLILDIIFFVSSC